MPVMGVGDSLIGGDDTQEQLTQDAMRLEFIEQVVVSPDMGIHFRDQNASHGD